MLHHLHHLHHVCHAASVWNVLYDSARPALIPVWMVAYVATAQVQPARLLEMMDVAVQRKKDYEARQAARNTFGQQIAEVDKQLRKLERAAQKDTMALEAKYKERAVLEEEEESQAATEQGGEKKEGNKKIVSGGMVEGGAATIEAQLKALDNLLAGATAAKATANDRVEELVKRHQALQVGLRPAHVAVYSPTVGVRPERAACSPALP